MQLDLLIRLDVYHKDLLYLPKKPKTAHDDEISYKHLQSN